MQWNLQLEETLGSAILLTSESCVQLMYILISGSLKILILSICGPTVLAQLNFIEQYNNVMLICIIMYAVIMYAVRRILSYKLTL